jgi:peptidoglycan/LPS O-acetylase OafA/YrhL
MGLLACVIAAVVYVWQEQKEFSFPQLQLAVFVVITAAVAIGMRSFRRGSSRIQPPEMAAGVLRFVGRHTLEIYAIQLAASELIIKLVPDLAG